MENLEQYKVIADYERKDSHQVTLHAGQIVHVIEKHDTGRWESNVLSCLRILVVLDVYTSCVHSMHALLIKSYVLHVCVRAFAVFLCGDV